MTTITLTKPRHILRQTNLRQLEEGCPAMVYALTVEGREGPSFEGAMRGHAVHEVFAAYVHHLARAGRETDWEVIEQITDDVLAGYPEISFTERREVREQAANIGRGFIFEPAALYGVEESFHADFTINSTTYGITGRLDLLEVWGDEGRARITDLKSNHAIPSDAALREDYQLRTYAYLVMANLPEVDTVEGRLWFTRYGVYRPKGDLFQMTREEVPEFEAHVKLRLAAHFSGALRRRYVPGNHCVYCPRRKPGDCNVWRSYHETTPPPPLTEKQAVRLARQLKVLEDSADVRKALLKEYAREHGPVSVGGRGSYGWRMSESVSYPVTEFLELLEEFAPEIGEAPLDELLTVNKSSKLMKALKRDLPDFAARLEDIAVESGSTSFRWKGTES